VLESVRRALTRPPVRVKQEHGPMAAVAMVLMPGEDVLFIRRAVKPTDPWSGHVSFPGGRKDPADPDTLTTAIRETREEVGVDLGRAHLIGELDEVRTVGVEPALVIRPYVFAAEAPAAFALQAEEVAGVHRFPLERLLAGDGRGMMKWSRHGFDLDLPCIDFDGVRLWGLTLLMVDDLLHRLDGRGVGAARNRG
jgi:8-oxo-dGTP pyrophosphatase MutT (NUDIX family)